MICSPFAEVIGVSNSSESGTVSQHVKELLPVGKQDTICLASEEEGRVVWRAEREALGVQYKDPEGMEVSRRGV